MRNGVKRRRDNDPVEQQRHAGRRFVCLEVSGFLMGFLPAILHTDNAAAYAVPGFAPAVSVGVSSSRLNELAGGLYAPKTQSPHQGGQKIQLAHAIIVRTSPPQNGVAPGNIGKVDVWYDAGIRDSLAALAVVSAAGERIDKRDAAIDSADPAHVSVSVNPMTPGKYTVRYRALSADGHMVSGAWEFDVQP